MSRAELIEAYRHGSQAFAKVVSRVPEDRYDASPGPGEWTPRQIIHHLADAELRATVRLRQLLAEENPLIQGYDEERYTERLPLDRSITVSLEAIRIAREANLELLVRAPEDAWANVGQHTESGPYMLEDWLRIYTAHPLDHAQQLERAAAAG